MIQRTEGEPDLLRTASFFDQSLSQVAEALVEGDGMVIALPNSERKIRVTKVEEFPKVGLRWSAISRMEPGDLWNPRFIKVVQSLIVVRGEVLPGACVRLLEAEYFNTDSGQFIPRLQVERNVFDPKEDHIARYLGLTATARSRLVLFKEPDTLFIVPR